MGNRKITMIHRIRKSFVTKVVAMYLAIFTLFDVVYPTASWALTGGPSQPEVAGFQPIETSDMVDIFSGDFKYNIPLFDLDGYPLNLAYNGGVSADAEASWVGLGWNFNPGVINRNMRGIPDDFAGEQIKKTYNVKPSSNFGINGGVTLELFGIDAAVAFSGSLNFGIGINYSNYYGIGIEQKVGIDFKVQAGPLTGDLGIESSSENGLTISPKVTLGLNRGQKAAKGETSSLAPTGSLGIGTSYNTRAGLKQLTITADFSKQFKENSKSNQNTNAPTGIAIGASATFDLGMPTFTPSVSMSMHNISITGNFQAGAEAFGSHPAGYLGGYYSGQNLINITESNPAFGYMNLDLAQHNTSALLDFNRENDGEFTTSTPALPVTNLTFDTYNVSGQGVGGSYRPFRSEIGYVFDPDSYSTSEGFDIGLEFGAANLVHVAGQFSVNVTGTNSGKWVNNNHPTEHLQYGKKGSNIDYERYYFKEANEKSVDSDPAYYNKFGGDQAVRFKLNTSTDFDVSAENTFVKNDQSEIAVPSDNYRNARDKRNQVIHPLTIKEVKDGMGLDYFPAGSYAQTSANEHHIGEITSYGTDGMRYVYGLPAYNTLQKDVSFAVGGNMYNQGNLNGNCVTGVVNYTPNVDNNPTGNERGIDNYYNATELPAYAHSYLLTAVLTPDYIDADNVKGPSVGDMGYYTKFSYTRADSNYQWRTPYGSNAASFNEALKTDPSDDRGSYIYGTKEMWYIEKIESKNYIAIFELENRKDALAVASENGGINTTQPSKLLRSIKLYARKDYLEKIAASQIPVPLKTVHFEYDYSLCTGIPNYSNLVSGVNPNENGGGKLTLKKVYFTYQNSNKARLSPYTFQYNGSNPAYDAKSYDRWGNYKQNGGGCGYLNALTNAENPYVEQNQATADVYSSAWNLTTILLPSGGSINLEYESDDYAYVQNKQAMQMLKIVGLTNNATGTIPTPGTAPSLGDIADPTKFLVFELDPNANTAADIPKYFDGVQNVYFKALMQMRPGNFDYVAGYAEIDGSNYGMVSDGTTNYGTVRLKGVNWNDSGIWGTVNPIVRSAVQFGRLHLQRFVYQNPAITDADNFGEQLLAALFSSNLLEDLINNVSEFAQGPNRFLYNNREVGANVVFRKSWLRLNNPDGKKLGGGCRVKKIKMNDHWEDMTGISGQSFDYGQEYFYDENGDGTGKSTGVASYEPQIGGEENPWKQPITFSIENCMAPDEKMYQEEPLGETFFPTPSVGYAKVTVQNLKRTNVTRHATGKVVHEFYTAKDFPTIIDRTDRQLERDKTDPFSISSMLYISSRDFLTVSQGFVVELNDMHGKAKKQSVYQENQNSAITSVEYKYKQNTYLNGSFRLNNSATTVSSNGAVSINNIGMAFDMVADMRQSTSQALGFKLNINAENFLIFAFPITIAPLPWPTITNDETQFRSAATTKVIQRFGLLDEVIATDLGSVVATKNLAYDAETGEVLVTQTTTDFNDAVYTLNYPAHWYYEKGMGQAYKNIGLTINHSFSAGIANFANAPLWYVPGDELELVPTSGTVKKGWVVSVNNNSITIVDKAGNHINGTYTSKIIRSGRRNLQTTNIASVTTLSNPLSNFSSNLFTNVLQASAVEFSDQWRTFCDCYDASEDFAPPSSNPYILGTRGNWRMKKSLLHLAQRTQSHYNNNTNVRKDGMYTSYTPYYKLDLSHWVIDGKNWTYTSEVTNFSPFGQELENKDALGRYSAATFGYRQTFATAVAANARYRDIGVDNFEDYGFSPCADNHFKFTGYESNLETGKAHTGRTSIKVIQGVMVTMLKPLELCDAGGCDIGITAPGTETNYTITGGTAPYNIQYNILYGDPGFMITMTGFSLTGTDYSIQVTITDAQGCTFTTTITR